MFTMHGGIAPGTIEFALLVGAKRDLHRTISFEHSDASKKKIDEMTGSLQATKATEMVSRMWAPRLPQDAGEDELKDVGVDDACHIQRINGEDELKDVGVDDACRI
eukprot:gene23144-28008_t